ncbi:MAG TPA: hypothetical protein VE075_02565 [Thermoanaerobaculia bacterium]|nr:hypothetical protein [Thermoanaerobaculia bacterium]
MSANQLDGFSSTTGISCSAGDRVRLLAAALAPTGSAFTITATKDSLSFGDPRATWKVTAWSADGTSAYGYVTDNGKATHPFSMSLTAGTLYCTVEPSPPGPHHGGDDGGSWSANDGRSHLGGGEGRGKGEDG